MGILYKLFQLILIYSQYYRYPFLFIKSHFTKKISVRNICTWKVHWKLYLSISAYIPPSTFMLIRCLFWIIDEVPAKSISMYIFHRLHLKLQTNLSKLPNCGYFYCCYSKIIYKAQQLRAFIFYAWFTRDLLRNYQGFTTDVLRIYQRLTQGLPRIYQGFTKGLLRIC